MTTIEFLRQFRIGGYAIFDFAVSFLGIYLLAPLLSRITKHLHLIIPKKNWLFLTIPISILVHILVGNITPLTKNFLNIHSHYPLKILIIALLLLGLQGIRKTKK